MHVLESARDLWRRNSHIRLVTARCSQYSEISIVQVHVEHCSLQLLQCGLALYTRFTLYDVCVGSRKYKHSCKVGVNHQSVPLLQVAICLGGQDAVDVDECVLKQVMR